MTQLHRACVSDAGFTKDGIHVYCEHGEPMTISGSPMVGIYGIYIPAAGWHATEAGAWRAAATKIEELGNRLIAQAEQLRANADASEVIV